MVHQWQCMAENEIKYIDLRRKIYVQNLFRIFSNVQNLFRIFSNVQNLFRIFSNVQNLFRIFSNFQQCSEFSVMFRIFSNFQNFQNLFRIFRICSEFLVTFRIFRLFSEYLAQKLVCSESLDLVVIYTDIHVCLFTENVKTTLKSLTKPKG